MWVSNEHGCWPGIGSVCRCCGWVSPSAYLGRALWSTETRKAIQPFELRWKGNCALKALEFLNLVCWRVQPVRFGFVLFSAFFAIFGDTLLHISGPLRLEDVAEFRDEDLCSDIGVGGDCLAPSPRQFAAGVECLTHCCQRRRP